MEIVNFTPVSALIGGALIGVAATMLLWLNGRVAGISGILGGLLPPAPKGERGWRAMFLIGLVIGGFLFAFVGGAEKVAEIQFVATLPVMAVAGLLVGFGTRMGSGCTSGHGVCGMARLSARSIVATLTFMATAGITVFIIRHVIGG